MNNNDGSLSFKMDLDNDDFRRRLKVTENQIRGFSDTSAREIAKLDSSFSRMGRNLSAAAAVTGLGALAREVVKVRGEFQQLEVAFKTMLGSKEKADLLMNQAVELAAKTPFTLQDVATGAKQMIAYGFAAENVISQIKMLGDIASGVSTDLSGLVYLYGTLKTSGRVTIIDLQQFAGRGVPIFEQLSLQLGVTTAEIRGLVSAGKIGFPQIEKAFQSMTSSGGMFFNLMEEQSRTVTGRISNLQDSWSRMLNEIGQNSDGAINTTISSLQYLVDNYEQVGKIILELVATYGAYKAAVISIAVLNKAAITFEQIKAVAALNKAFGSLTFATKGQVVAQATLNALNPAGWISLAVAGVTALVAGYALWHKETVNLRDIGEDFNRELLNQKTNIDAVFYSLQNTQKGTQGHAEAMKSANEILKSYNLGLLDEKSGLNEITLAYERATAAMVKNVAIQSKKEELDTKLKELNEGFKDSYSDLIDSIESQGKRSAQTSIIASLNERLKIDGAELLETVRSQSGVIGDQIVESYDITDKAKGILSELSKQTGLSFSSIKDYAIAYSQYVKDQATIVRDVTDYYQPWIQANQEGITQADKLWQALRRADTKEAKDSILQQLKELSGSTGIKPEAIQSVARLNDELTKLKDEQAAVSGTSAQWNDYQKKIVSVERKIQAITGTKTKVEPLGSLSYWEAVKKETEEAISKLSTAEYEPKIEGLKSKLTEAQKAIDEIQFRTQPFDVQLDYMRSEYGLYATFVENLGEASANQLFSNLVSKGKDYENYLLSEQARLIRTLEVIEAKKTELLGKPTRTKSENTQLTTYSTQTENIQRQLVEVNIRLRQEGSPEAVLERFRTQMDKVTGQASKLSEKLNLLNSIKKEVGLDLSPIGMAQYDEVSKKIEDITGQIQTQYGAIVEETSQFADRMNSIQRDQKSTQTDKVDLSGLSEELSARNQVYKSLLGDLSGFSLQQINLLIDSVSKLIQRPEFTEIKSEIETILNKAKSGISELGYVGYSEWSEQLQQVYEKLSLLGPEAEIQAGLMSKALKASKLVYSIEVESKYNITPPDLSDVKPIDQFTPAPVVVPVQVEPINTEAAINKAFGSFSEVASQTLNIQVDTGSFDTTLNELLTKYKGYSQSRLEIESTFNNDLRVLNTALKGAQTDAEKARVQDSISQRKKEYQDQLLTLEKSLGSYEEFYNTVQQLGRGALNKQIEHLKTQADVARAKYGEQSDEYKNLLKVLGTAQKAASNSDFAQMASYMQVAANAAGIFSSELASTIQSTYEILSNISTITNELNKEKPDYSSIAGATLSVVSNVIKAFDLTGEEAKTLHKQRISEAQEMNSIINTSINAQADRESYINQLYRNRLVSVLKINEATLHGLELLQQAQALQVQNAQEEYQGLVDEAIRWAKAFYSGNSTMVGLLNSYTGQDLIDWYTSGAPMPEYLQALIQKIIEAKGVVEDYGLSLEETAQKTRDLLSGTTAAALADEIISAFKAGEVGIEAFGQKFEDIMRNAIISQLKASILMPIIEDFLKQFDQFILFGGADQNLANFDFQQFEDQFNAAMEQFQSIFDYTSEALGIDLTGGNILSMQGAIKGITEESASLIAGQFNAMRIIQYGIFEAVNDSLRELQKIEFNTRSTSTNTKQLLTTLRAMDSKLRATGREYGG